MRGFSSQLCLCGAVYPASALSPLWRADHWDKDAAVDRVGVGGGPTPPSFNPGVEFGVGDWPLGISAASSVL